MWAVARALNSVGKSSGRVTEVSRKQVNYSWDNLAFSVVVQEIGYFGGRNNIDISLMGLVGDAVTAL
jgi:hypothetical protein